LKKILQITKIAAINILIIVVLLILIDPFLGKKADDPGKTYRSLNLREFGPNRTLVLDATTFPDNKDDSLDHQFYHIQTDNLGFIVGPDDVLDAQPDIIFFGGSTTECAFVDDSLRFPYLVQKELKRTLRQDIVVRNGGYGGNHTMHSVVNLMGKGLIQKPKWVVFMHNSNDLSQLSKTGTYWKAPGNRDLLNQNYIASSKTWGQRFTEWRNASLGFFIPNITKAVYGLKRNSEAGDEWQGMRSAEFIGLQAIETQYRQALSTFVGIAKANNIPVVIMTQFNRINLSDKKVRDSYNKVQNPISYEDYVAYYSRFSDIIREVAAQENIPLIDLDKAVPHKSQYLVDAVHLNNAGSRLVSEIVADSLVSILSVERSINKNE
jgi:lysophospholipase L1-like esterase